MHVRKHKGIPGTGLRGKKKTFGIWKWIVVTVQLRSANPKKLNLSHPVLNSVSFGDSYLSSVFHPFIEGLNNVINEKPRRYIELLFLNLHWHLNLTVHSLFVAAGITSTMSSHTTGTILWWTLQRTTLWVTVWPSRRWTWCLDCCWASASAGCCCGWTEFCTVRSEHGGRVDITVRWSMRPPKLSSNGNVNKTSDGGRGCRYLFILLFYFCSGQKAFNRICSWISILEVLLHLEWMQKRVSLQPGHGLSFARASQSNTAVGGSPDFDLPPTAWSILNPSQ